MDIQSRGYQLSSFSPAQGKQFRKQHDQKNSLQSVVQNSPNIDWVIISNSLFENGLKHGANQKFFKMGVIFFFLRLLE